MTRLKVHHMAEGGVPQAAIAEKTGISLRSVERILGESPPVEQELRTGRREGGRGPGRPSRTLAFRKQVEALLTERPDVPTTEVLRQSRQWGYQGQSSALYELVRQLRPARVTEPVVRFEGLPGEFAQFDFGEARLRFCDGSQRKVVFFVGRLKYSRFLHVVVTCDQQAETFIRALLSCLHAFGGAPKEWVFDNPKTIRLSRPGEAVVFHPYLRDLSADLNVLPTLCTPRRPNQKGSVENGVGFVKKYFLFARAFQDMDDLTRQLPEWLYEVNFVRPCDATKEPPATRLAAERPWLDKRPLPWTPEEYPLRYTVQVTPTATFSYEGTAYSAPPRRIGATGTLLVRARSLTLIVDSERCTHTRLDGVKTVQRLPEHRHEMLKVIHGTRKHNYYQRQCLLELGPEAHDFLEQLIHRSPAGSWAPVVKELFNLAQRHASHDMCQALGLAHQQGRYDLAAVVHHLRGAA